MADEVTPLVCRYRSLMNVEWLTEPGINHIYTMFSDLFCICEYQFLPTVVRRPNEPLQDFADRTGICMAAALRVPYVPFSSDDYLYFIGQRDISKCSSEFLRSYGWMGQRGDYQLMCKMHGLNALYEHSRNLFRPDMYMHLQQRAQSIIDARLSTDVALNKESLMRPFIVV